MIKEKFGKNAKWKFPGGIVDQNETLESAAVREVLEETGIQTTFERIMSMGALTEWRHGQGGLYFPCLLRLKGSDEI